MNRNILIVFNVAVLLIVLIVIMYIERNITWKREQFIDLKLNTMQLDSMLLNNGLQTIVGTLTDNDNYYKDFIASTCFDIEISKVVKVNDNLVEWQKNVGNPGITFIALQPNASICTKLNSYQNQMINDTFIVDYLRKDSDIPIATCILALSKTFILRSNVLSLCDYIIQVLYNGNITTTTTQQQQPIIQTPSVVKPVSLLSSLLPTQQETVNSLTMAEESSAYYQSFAPAVDIMVMDEQSIIEEEAIGKISINM